MHALRAALAALALTSAFAQDFTEIRIERAVAEHYRYLNSPAWWKEGYLVYADSPTNRVMRWGAGQKPELYLDDAQGASGLAFDGQGRLYICQPRARRVIRLDRNKREQPMAEHYQGKRLNAPNDIVIRKDGAAFFTDPAFGYQQDTRELDFYGVYRLSSKGDPEPVIKWKTRPNGLALSPNGKLLYVSDADRREVHVFDLDRSGAVSGERVFVKSIPGVPGGMCADEKGNIYVAARGLEIYSPDAKPLRTVQLPVAASGCSFGDGDGQSLLVTAGPVMYRIRLDVKGAFQY